MAESASTNPAATVARFLLALVVVAAGAREGPASAPAPQEADGDGSFSFDGHISAPAPAPQEADDDGSFSFDGPISAPAPEDADGAGSGSFDRPFSTAAGPTLVPASAPVVVSQEAGSVGTVSFDRTVSRDSRRCDSDMRWNDQLCRNVCGMFKFYGYEFAEATADEGRDAVPRCCCCPGGATCIQL